MAHDGNDHQRAGELAWGLQPPAGLGLAGVCGEQRKALKEYGFPGKAL